MADNSRYKSSLRTHTTQKGCPMEPEDHQAQIGAMLDHMAEAGTFALDLSTAAGKRQFANALFQVMAAGGDPVLVHPAESRIETADTDAQAQVDAAVAEQAPEAGGETEANPSPQPDLVAGA